MERSAIRRIYEDHYRVLMLIPFLLLVLAASQIGYQYSTTGEFLLRGVSLKGGISLTAPELVVDGVALQDHLRNTLPAGDFTVRSVGQNKGIVIDASDVTVEELLSALDSFGTPVGEGEYSAEEFGSALGSAFFSQTIRAVLFAFLFMGAVVFLVFRSFGPSIGVILAAFSDILCTLAVVNLMGMRISTAGIAAFLMLIGYSVDTDILLSTRVLKNNTGTVMSRIYSSMKTGLTMTLTTFVAVLVALILSKSPTITEIMVILLIGLIFDVLMTYIQNVAILRIFVERKKNGKHR